jgi:hypothetical protein
VKFKKNICVGNKNPYLMLFKNILLKLKKWKNEDAENWKLKVKDRFSMPK